MQGLMHFLWRKTTCGQCSGKRVQVKKRKKHVFGDLEKKRKNVRIVSQAT